VRLDPVASFKILWILCLRPYAVSPWYGQRREQRSKPCKEKENCCYQRTTLYNISCVWILYRLEPKAATSLSPLSSCPAYRAIRPAGYTLLRSRSKRASCSTRRVGPSGGIVPNRCSVESVFILNEPAHLHVLAFPDEKDNIHSLRGPVQCICVFVRLSRCVFCACP
jgi:hypothetical protein